MLLTEFWASFWPNWAVFGLKTLKHDFSPKNYSVQLLRFYVALTSWKKSKTFQALIFQNKIFKFFQNKIFDFFFPKTKFWARLGSLSPQNPRTIFFFIKSGCHFLKLVDNGIRTHNQFVYKQTLNNLFKLAYILLKSLKLIAPVLSKVFLDIQAAIKCRSLWDVKNIRCVKNSYKPFQRKLPTNRQKDKEYYKGSSFRESKKRKIF